MTSSYAHESFPALRFTPPILSTSPTPKQWRDIGAEVWDHNICLQSTNVMWKVSQLKSMAYFSFDNIFPSYVTTKPPAYTKMPSKGSEMESNKYYCCHGKILLYHTERYSQLERQHLLLGQLVLLEYATFLFFYLKTITLLSFCFSIIVMFLG